MSVGPTPGEAAAAQAVCGAATAPVASGGAGTRPTTHEEAGGVRKRALGALAGDGGVGRDHGALSEGSVLFSGQRAVWACVRVIFRLTRCVCKVRSAT